MMRKTLKLTVAILIILSILSATAAYALGNNVYTNTRLLADNLEYINSISWHSTLGRTESFAIRMNGQGDAYPIILSGDTIFGSTRISTMLSFAERQGWNVLAISNADFFSMQTGIPMGIVIENGVYKSSPSEYPAICFDRDGNASFVESARVAISLYNEGGAEETDNTGEVVNLTHFNKVRHDFGGMYLLNEDFSTVSTRTSSHGWFVRFSVLEGTPSVSGTMKLQVTETLSQSGAVSIGSGNMILTAATSGGWGDEFVKFAVGDIVTLTTTSNDQKLTNAAFATGGGDVLVRDGVKTPSSGWDSGLRSGRAPRTAFGAKADGTVVSYIVDGRSTDHSIGLTLNELADEMLRQGCVYVVNLDGGGSTALSVRIPGESRAGVVNRLSDGAERGCATYMLFVTDARSDGVTRNLSLRNNGAIVLAGSSIDLTFTATDRGYMPSHLPGDIEVTPFGAEEPINGSRYTVGNVAGPELMSLYSPSADATGIGEVYVITRPTSMTVTRSGSSTQLQSVSLRPGEILNLDMSATYYRRTVTAQPQSFTFTVTGGIGAMTAPGVFRAGNMRGQTGTIRVSVADRTADIWVEVGVFDDMTNHWASEPVYYLANRGVVQGVTDVRFNPQSAMKRGDYILMLYRGAGEPAVSGTASFDDVPAGLYYARAIAWAKQAGILDSVTGTRFRPEDPVTRQDAMTFTYHALDAFNIRYTNGTAADIAGFPDAGTVDAYAVVPIATLVRLGIIEGSNGMLVPHNNMTRAQMAKVLADLLQRQ